MDKEILDLIKAKMEEVKILYDSVMDEIDVTTVMSEKLGKEIAPDFDETDLISIQASIDEAATLLRDLSIDLDEYL